MKSQKCWQAKKSLRHSDGNSKHEKTHRIVALKNKYKRWSFKAYVELLALVLHNMSSFVRKYLSMTFNAEEKRQQKSLSLSVLVWYIYFIYMEVNLELLKFSK